MLILFEIDEVNVERFYFNRLGDSIENSELVVVIEDPKELSKFRLKYPEIISYLFLEWLRGVSKTYKNCDVFINGNRIPDLLMTKISRENDCRVIFIQHGMYVDFMKREVSLFINNFRKALRYAYYALCLNSVISLFKIHILGHSRDLTSCKKELYPHYAFVYSQYWKEWHRDKYFFENVSRYFYLSNNDSIQNEIKLDASAIYCYQTLIEDGRIDLNYFEKIFDEISNVVKNNGLEIVVKGHPRMSNTTKKFFDNKGIRVITNQFPTSTLIIGHYSTLLARWVFNNDTLIAIQLDGHDIPEPIQNLATSVCQITELSDVLAQDVKRDANELKELSDYYFNFSGLDSVYKISDILRVCDS